MTKFARIIDTVGGHNLSDIGGYVTTDGRVTAWGRVFRSRTMAAIEDVDFPILEALGLQAICDFRSTSERNRRPSQLPPSTQGKVWCRDYETSGADLVRALALPDATPSSAKVLMIDLYRKILSEQKASFRALFEHIAAGRLPILFHCAAGKDRTGVAAALLLNYWGFTATRSLPTMS